MDKMSVIVRYCRFLAEKKLKEYDLTFGEQIIILYLSKHDNVNQDAISKQYMIDKGMVAKTLSKLEHKGFIRRAQNPENKRENIISLTEKGNDMLIKIRNVHKEWNEILYEGMSEEDMANMKKLTGKMVANISKHMD